MHHRKLPIVLFVACLMSGLFAQPSLRTSKELQKVDIPFEYQNNLIIVNVIFNRILPLKFIFDTGAEHTILARREITDLFAIRYEREFKLIGSDMKTELTAYLVRGIPFEVGNMLLPRHSMLVLKDDYFHFKQVAGIDIYGIIGADVFRGMVVHINYERRVISLIKSNSFKTPPESYKPVPIEVYRNKPYLFTKLKIKDDTTVVKLLIDTGAALAFLVNTNTDSSLTLPPNTIKGNVGIGLGGFLEGYLGRVKNLQIGDYNFRDVITTFQDLDEAIDSSFVNSRNGILGNQMLDRFSVYIDYPRETMYLRPNRYFKDKFEFDKSGLFVVVAGKNLNSYVVHQLIPGSPAADAGVLPGDIIKRINCATSGLLSLHSIHNSFRKKEGKKITMVVKRGKERVKFVFHLRNLI